MTTALSMLPALDRRTYGTLTYRPDLFDTGRHGWVLRAEPHVTQRLRRIFPRALRPRSGGGLAFRDTTETAMDLEWTNERYPLRMDVDTQRRLTERAEEFRAADIAVRSILAGHRPQHGWREPAVPLRDYQQQAADIMHAAGHLLLADDVGVGKTACGGALFLNPDALPGLVVTLTHLPGQWQRELERFFPWLRTHVLTKGTHYDITKACGGTPPDVLITSYSKISKWGDHLAGLINGVVFDKIQELRNTDTMRYTGAAAVADQATYRAG